MFRIKTLNKIASVGLAQLDKGRFVVEERLRQPRRHPRPLRQDARL